MPSYITIKTNFTPPITFDPFGREKTSGRSLLGVLQPSIEGNLPFVGDIHYAPKGNPSGQGVILFYVVIGLALYGAYKIFA